MQEGIAKKDSNEEIFEEGKKYVFSLKRFEEFLKNVPEGHKKDAKEYIDSLKAKDKKEVFVEEGYKYTALLDGDVIYRIFCEEVSG